MNEPIEKCPKCGSARRSWSKYHVSYVCGTLSEDEESGDLTQSDACHIIADLTARLAEATGQLKRLWHKEITELLKQGADHDDAE